MKNPTKLNILWTSNQPETFDEMVFMYALNGKKRGWWDEVTLIIWGASARLCGEDEVIQLKLRELIQNGVIVTACKACADDLSVGELLESLEVEVKYWGQPLTSLLQSGEKLITI